MKFKVGLCQIRPDKDPAKNYKAAKCQIKKAKDGGAVMVTLPEIWTTSYAPYYCLKYAEEPEGKAYQVLQQAAKDNEIWVFGGSMPVKTEDPMKITNTCFVFNPKGECMGRYDKLHPFDADSYAGITTKESAFTQLGDHKLIIETEYCKVGVTICYDVRFPAYFNHLAAQGCKVMMVPSAYSRQTGERHWDILTQGRALDCQAYLVGCQAGRNEENSYVTYGHSHVVDPFGFIIDELGEGEGVLVTELDMDLVDDIRRGLPIRTHERHEIYGY